MAEKKRKLVVGWFSFTCSEDSTILFTELLNDHLKEWKKMIEFRHAKVLKSHNRLENLDVAFVEGAISSEKQKEELQRIRDNSKYLVAVGACACSGQPSASRNQFVSEEINFKVFWFLEHFDYSQKVRKLSDFVKVDDEVLGCPMDPDLFLKVLEKYLKICTTEK